MNSKFIIGDLVKANNVRPDCPPILDEFVSEHDYSYLHIDSEGDVGRLLIIIRKFEGKEVFDLLTNFGYSEQEKADNKDIALKPVYLCTFGDRDYLCMECELELA